MSIVHCASGHVTIPFLAMVGMASKSDTDGLPGLAALNTFLFPYHFTFVFYIWA